MTTVSSGTGQFRDPRRPRSDTDGFPLPALTRADLLLALIPPTFAIAFAAAAASPLALTETLGVASLIAVAAIVESVVVNPPISER